MEYRIRRARREELKALPEVERDAGERFREIEELAVLADDITPMEQLVEAEERGLVWIAESGGEVVGFAYCGLLDGNLHLEELAVVVRAGRQGVGRALVRTVILHALESGMPAVTLTTFRHVPWNAPFYAGLGFRIVPPAELTPGLAAAWQGEDRRGLAIAVRIVMRLDLK